MWSTCRIISWRSMLLCPLQLQSTCADGWPLLCQRSRTTQWAAVITHNNVGQVAQKSGKQRNKGHWWLSHGSLYKLTEIHSIMIDYHKTPNISRSSVGNKVVDNSDVVGASPVGAASTTSSFSTQQLASMDWAKTTARGYKKHLNFGIWCDLT